MISPAQQVQETEQEMKEREKRLREHKDEVAFAKASNSLRRGYFVLVADNIQIGNMGYRHYDISRNSNFILVQGEDGIVQFALNTGFPGTMMSSLAASPRQVTLMMSPVTEALVSPPTRSTP